jgi:hypothetical protein
MPYSDPDMQRAAQREHARRKRAQRADRDSEGRTLNGDVEPAAQLVPVMMQIEKADDVLDVLTRQVRAIEASKSADPLMRARAIAQLAGPMLRAMEARDAAIIRDIEGHLATLDEYAREACTDLIAQVVRACIDALPIQHDRQHEVPDIVRRTLRSFGTLRDEPAKVAALPAGE